MAVRNRTAQELHGFLLEWGIESRRGIGSPLGRLPGILEDAQGELTPDGRALLSELGGELRRLDERVKRFDARIEAVAQADPACRRLQAIPGIGPLTTTALVAAVGDPSAFRNGRELAAWLGLVPRQRSTGGRMRLLGISKRGDRCLRCLLVHGARATGGGAPRRPAQPVGGRGGGAPRPQRRHRGAGQQERPHGLGRAGRKGRLRPRPRRQEPRKPQRGGLTGPKPASRRHGPPTVARSEAKVMAGQVGPTGVE